MTLLEYPSSCTHVRSNLVLSSSSGFCVEQVVRNGFGYDRIFPSYTIASPTSATVKPLALLGFISLLCIATTSSVTDMSGNSNPLRVLVTGASGYLGQFFVDEILRSDWAKGAVQLCGTYQGRREGIPPGVEAFQLNFQDDGEEKMEAVLRAARPDVVVNLAAISSPAACEKDEAAAMAANCPLPLLTALRKVNAGALFVQLSTDQVFDGRRPPYSRKTERAPVNAYGRSKLAFEAALPREWPRHVILRSSLIVGPAPPRPCARSGSFLHFLDAALAPAPDAPPVALFADEVRSAVAVGDVVGVLSALLRADLHQVCASEGEEGVRAFNLGGPRPLSRVDMGLVVCRLRGYGEERVEASLRAEQAMGFESPLNITMLRPPPAVPHCGQTNPDVRGGSEDLFAQGWVRAALPSGATDFEQAARDAFQTDLSRNTK